MMGKRDISLETTETRKRIQERMAFMEMTTQIFVLNTENVLPAPARVEPNENNHIIKTDCEKNQ